MTKNIYIFPNQKKPQPLSKRKTNLTEKQKTKKTKRRRKEKKVPPLFLPPQLAEPLMNSFPVQPQVLLRKPTLLLRVSEQNPEPPPTYQITIWEGKRERQIKGQRD